MVKPTTEEIQEFSDKIITLSKRTNSSMLETLLTYIDESGLDYDVAAALLSPLLTSLLQNESEELGLLKRNNYKITL